VRQLYLDCDGVLADFDKGATAVLGMPPRDYEKAHGLGRFWQKLAQAPDFYFGLPLLPDAMRLFEAVKHLPRGNWAAGQKIRWAARHFPGTRIITTLARDKRNHAKGGRRARGRSAPPRPPLAGDGRHLHPPCRRGQNARGAGQLFSAGKPIADSRDGLLAHSAVPGSAFLQRISAGAKWRSVARSG
jgi:hypothetical protein